MKNLFTYIFIFVSLTGYTQEFHVTTSGNDGAPGTNTQPWESIQHAMDNATPGSTVLIHEGVYNERLYMNVSGTEGNYITFKAFSDDEDVIVDGTGLTDNALLEIYDIHHVAIESIKFTNNVQLDAIGILIEGACDHIRIEDCDISNIKFTDNPDAPITDETNAQGLIVYGTEPDHPIVGLEILDNEIYDCVLGYSEGLAINGNVDGFIVAENEVHDVTNIGIDIIGHEGTCWEPALDQARNGIVVDNETYNCQSPYATAAGIYVDGGSNIIIERNKVYNNQWGIEIGSENIGKYTSDIVVRNNFIYGNTTAGIACGGYDYPNTGIVSNTTISNNTIYGNDTENDYSGEMYLSYNEGLIVTSNIFYATTTTGVMFSDENLTTPSSEITMYKNAWYHPMGEGNIEFTFEGQYYNSLNEFQIGTGFGDNSGWTDPLFVSIGPNPDLHITSNSPVRDWGPTPFTNSGEFDIDGEVRLYSTSIDLGADELDSSVGVAEVTNSTLEIYPNPVTDKFILKTHHSEISELVITDLQGKIVYTMAKNYNPNAWIDINHLNTGIYMVHVQDNDGNTFQSKLIKK